MFYDSSFSFSPIRLFLRFVLKNQLWNSIVSQNGVPICTFIHKNESANRKYNGGISKMPRHWHCSDAMNARRMNEERHTITKWFFLVSFDAFGVYLFIKFSLELFFLRCIFCFFIQICCALVRHFALAPANKRHDGCLFRVGTRPIRIVLPLLRFSLHFSLGQCKRCG